MKIMENSKNKLNILLVCFTVVCSVFLVGYKNSYALSSDFSTFYNNLKESIDKCTTSDQRVDTFYSMVELSGYNYCIFNQNTEVSGYYYYCVVTEDSSISYGKTGSNNYISFTCSNRGSNKPFSVSMFDHPPFYTDGGSTINGSMKLVSTSCNIKSSNGTVLFRKPLLKEVETLLPGVTADMKTVLMMVVGFLGLLILLWILSKRFKGFFLG